MRPMLSKRCGKNESGEYGALMQTLHGRAHCQPASIGAAAAIAACVLAAAFALAAYTEAIGARRMR